MHEHQLKKKLGPHNWDSNEYHGKFEFKAGNAVYIRSSCIHFIQFQIQFTHSEKDAKQYSEFLQIN